CLNANSAAPWLGVDGDHFAYLTRVGSAQYAHQIAGSKHRRLRRERFEGTVYRKRNNDLRPVTLSATALSEERGFAPFGLLQQLEEGLGHRLSHESLGDHDRKAKTVQRRKQGRGHTARNNATHGVLFCFLQWL